MRRREAAEVAEEAREVWRGAGGALETCVERRGRGGRPAGTHSLFIVAQTKKTKKLRRHIICANRSSVKSLRM